MMRRTELLILVLLCALNVWAQDKWFLVEPGSDSNVRIRTAPSLNAPQATMEFDGDKFPVYVPYGLPTKAYGEENQWFKLGENQWGSSTVLRRVDMDTELDPMSFSPNVYTRIIGSRSGSMATTIYYRVAALENGEYVLEMFNRSEGVSNGILYKGHKEGNVLVFPQAIMAAPMGYDEGTNLTIKNLDFYNIYIREIRFGKQKAVKLSDGTMGLDYAKLSQKELDQLFEGCDQHLQDEVFITAGMLSKARLNKAGKMN